MRALVQRVQSGAVIVGEAPVAKIKRGVVVLLGVGPHDKEEQARYLAEKIARLRIFEDAAGKMNRSLLDVAGAAIVVSQFTLYADTHKGRRPSFVGAASPEIAEPLVAHLAAILEELGVPTQTGQFGAHMLVDIVNDGPVTIWMEKD